MWKSKSMIRSTTFSIYERVVVVFECFGLRVFVSSRSKSENELLPLEVKYGTITHDTGPRKTFARIIVPVLINRLCCLALSTTTNNKLQRCDVRSMRYFFLARFNNKNTPYRINVWKVETRTQSFIQDATKEESW